MFINNCCVYCCVNYNSYCCVYYFGGGAGLVVRWAVLIKRGWVLFEAAEELTLCPLLGS